jgi:hypothetical protein
LEKAKLKKYELLLSEINDYLKSKSYKDIGATKLSITCHTKIIDIEKYYPELNSYSDSIIVITRPSASITQYDNYSITELSWLDLTILVLALTDIIKK